MSDEEKKRDHLDELEMNVPLYVGYLTGALSHPEIIERLIGIGATLEEIECFRISLMKFGGVFYRNP